jgi:hypothetical protein
MDNKNCVAVYDVKAKKCIAVFLGYRLADIFLWGKSRNCINAYITKRTKNHTNNLNIVVCFRSANTEQKALLSETSRYWVDEEYLTTQMRITLDAIQTKEFGATKEDITKPNSSKGSGLNEKTVKEIRKYRETHSINDTAEHFDMPRHRIAYYCPHDVPDILREVSTADLEAEVRRRKNK